MDSKKVTTILVVVFILVALILLFIFLNKGSFGSGTSELQPAENEVTTNNGQGLEFLRLLQSLNGLKLDGAILKNPIFTALTDFSIELKEEPLGRVNPFLPVEGGQGNSLVPPPNLAPKVPAKSPTKPAAK